MATIPIQGILRTKSIVVIRLHCARLFQEELALHRQDETNNNKKNIDNNKYLP